MSLEKHFDNLYKVIKTTITNLVVAPQSTEIDLDLPKGYIAKIKLVIIKYFLDGITAGTTIDSELLYSALVRDPDDAATIEIPENAVQHDVIMDYTERYNALLDATNGVGAIEVEKMKILNFDDMNVDVITARNIRFNAAASATTTHDVECTVYYTLEAIKKTELLELLDIL
jgi:hypothetical protein